jgi:hypothetical protein
LITPDGVDILFLVFSQQQRQHLHHISSVVQLLTTSNHALFAFLFAFAAIRSLFVAEAYIECNGFKGSCPSDKGTTDSHLGYDFTQASDVAKWIGPLMKHCSHRGICRCQRGYSKFGLEVIHRAALARSDGLAARPTSPRVYSHIMALSGDGKNESN